MKKRLISIITTLVLCLSLLPAAALAEETPSYSIDANGTLVISGTTDGSDLPAEGFTRIEITSTGVVTGGTYTAYVENYGTISGGNFGEVMNRNGGTGSGLALIEGGTFEKVSNYGNMTGGTVGELRNIELTNTGHSVSGVTVTGLLYNNNSNCDDMTLNIPLDKVTNIMSITTVKMVVDGNDVLCPVGQKANSWLKQNVADADWYTVEDGKRTPLTEDDVFPCGKTEYLSDRVTMVVNGTERLCPVGYPADAWLRNNVENPAYGWYRFIGEEWIKLTDTDVFPDTRTVYSKIPGMSFGTMGAMKDINDNWIARVGDTIGVTSTSAVWYVGNQQVAGTNQGWRVIYIVTEADIGKDAVAVLTDGYATVQGSPIRIVGPLSVTVPAAVAVGETITPVFNWQLKASPAEGMTYQWQRDGADIDGATMYTYIATQSDLGHKLTLAISVKGVPYYTTSEVAVAASAVTITGVSAATELEYNGEEQTGYTGTPASDYNGDYDITYTGRNGTVYDSTMPPINAGDYTVTFAVPTSNTTYAGRKSLDFSIAKAVITIKADNKTAYVGDTAPELTYTAAGLVNGETLKTEPTLAYETEPDMSKAGTTVIKVGGAEAPEGGNYDITYADGTLTVSTHHSTAYVPTVIQPDEGGSVTVSPKAPRKGDTVTITLKPEEGFEVEQVIVTDRNGNPVEVTDNGNGTYSFTQPSGKVTINVSFSDITTIPFTDVSSDAYYYDAVLWAVKKGITEGTGDGTTFSPDADCTRGQMVTFLWRAAGSPEPKSMSGFEDVAVDAYYAKAVAWAAENGITGGVGDNKFAPDDVCTRAQMAAFLCRMAGGKADSVTIDFTDVSADEYYAEAVQWAVENGITNGVGDNRFAPDGICTRGQMVTFLYRFFEN